jgi:hypothetical protein
MSTAKPTPTKGGKEVFDETAKKFRQFHKNSLNVALHLATTPLGIVR